MRISVLLVGGGLVLAGSGCHRDKVEEADCGEATLSVAAETVALSGDCGSVSLSPTILGDGALSVTLTAVDGAVLPTITAGAGGAVFNGLSLHGPVSLSGDSEPVIWKQGYQSWWWSGVAALEPVLLDARGLPTVGGDTHGASATEETPYTSWWVGLLGRADGASLLMGARSAEKTRFYVAFSEDEAWAVWGGRGESIALAEGESLALDPLVLMIDGDSWSLYVDYAEVVADGLGLDPPAERPPVGWSSWTVAYADLDEEIVAANLDAAVVINASALAPLDLFQLDDGWERAWGDWTANERFPSGMSSVAAEIQAAGLRPGLWMAPFYVEASTGLPDAHPDWFVLDDDGVPLSYSNFGDHDYRVIDVTQPDAAEWLRAQVAAQVAIGFTYLKLDFLYAGAQEGQRYSDVTGMQAYRIGVDLLREAAGPNTWILACGAPMLPSVGFAQSFRTGADIAFDFDPDPRPEYLRWQGRATAARAWSNGIWWWGDADAILVREPFDLVQTTGAVAANLASGGVWVLGDDLSTLDADKLAMVLDPDLVASRGQATRPEAPLTFVSGPDIGPLGELLKPDDAVPTRWALQDGTEIWLNLSDDEVEVEGEELAAGAGEVR